MQIECGCKNPNEPSKCKPTLPKEATTSQPPHSSIRARLEEDFRLENCKTCCKNPQTPVSRFIEANQSKSKMWTGLDAYDRETLWDFLGDDKYHLNMADQEDKHLSGEMRCLSVKCQFLLTLIILRRNYDYGECGGLFGGISDRIVSSVFKTWIIFMYRKFR